MMGKLTIEIQRLRPETDSDIPLPEYMTKGASGMDIFAAVEEPVLISPGDIKLIPTGFAVAIPSGFELQIRPRSGLAVKHGITVPNTPGTIDSDYRGEVKVALINLGRKNHTISRGDRIAQMVAAKTEHILLKETDSLDLTKRNHGGFGHTGG